MEITYQTCLIVCPFLFLAGLIDAIGGGGGLISLPAYLIAGLPPHTAIATNKLSSTCGTTLATYRFIKNGLVKQFEYNDLNRLKEEDNILLDTRTKEEYTRGHAEGFINIPLDALRSSLELLPKDKKIYVMCQSGLRSYIATRILMQNGYDAYNFIGGYRLYSSIFNDEILAMHSLPCGLEK